MKNKPLWPFTLNRASPQAKGLVLWVPGMWGSENPRDRSGYYNNAPFTATVPTTGFEVPGLDGGKQAITFDGSTANFSFGNPAVLNTSSVSVSCWVQLTDPDYNYICVKWGSAGGSDSFHLRIDGTTHFAYWNCSTSGSYQAANDTIGTTAVNDGKWHHLCGTYDQTTLKVYVDGILQTSVTATGGGGPIATTSSTVNWGGLSDNSATTNWFTGNMEDLKIHNYALPAAVVQDMYRSRTRWSLRFKTRNWNAQKLIIPPPTYGPEVKDGPMPGTPFFHLRQQQNITYFTVPPAPPAPPSNVPGQVIVSGPPLPGAPWFQLRQQQSITDNHPQVTAVAVTTPPPPITVVGPPLPGAPWFVLRQQQGIVHIQGQPPIVPHPTWPDKGFSGPPLPGTPWFQLRAQQGLVYTNAPTPDFNIVQTVTCQSRPTLNSGVLAAGRRPERPGKD